MDTGQAKKSRLCRKIREYIGGFAAYIFSGKMSPLYRKFTRKCLEKCHLGPTGIIFPPNLVAIGKEMLEIYMGTRLGTPTKCISCC